MRKKVYISGKIGKEAVPSEEVLQKFASAEKFLKAKGYKRDTGTETQGQVRVLPQIHVLFKISDFILFLFSLAKIQTYFFTPAKSRRIFLFKN